VRIDPRSGKIVAQVRVGSAAWTAASADAVWISTVDGHLARIDPATNRVAAKLSIAGSPLGDPAVVAGKVWIPVVRDNAVVIVDPATNRIERKLKVGKGPFVITEIAGQAWIPSWKGADIWRVNP